MSLIVVHLFCDIMQFPEILRTRRTVRLYQQKPIPWEELKECVDAARFAPSARNIQPMEYVVVTEENLRKEMLSCMGLGGFISNVVKDYSTRQPMAYIVVLVNKELRGNWTSHDCGLAVGNLVLAAWEKGIASCILARINKDKIHSLLKIPGTHEIELVVTMGYPAEKPVAVEMEKDTSAFRDAKGILHVPKRPLKQILHRNGF
jgi:nitroreductase